MKSVIVVGGGIAGILSALMLPRRADSVYLVEQEGRIGGLLRSIQGEYGHWFDYGTHVVRETGIPEIDSLMLKPVQDGPWVKHPYLRAGNFFMGRLNEQSSFIDARLLPPRRLRPGDDRNARCQLGLGGIDGESPAGKSPGPGC